MLLNRFKAGIPGKLRDQAQLIAGYFDEVVTQLSRVAGAQMAREFVREFNEGEQEYNKYASYICYQCGERGHIARKCKSSAVASKNHHCDQQATAARPRRRNDKGR